jgi:hypothetical protein
VRDVTRVFGRRVVIDEDGRVAIRGSRVFGGLAERTTGVTIQVQGAGTGNEGAPWMY